MNNMKRAKNIKDLQYRLTAGEVVICGDIHIPFQDDIAVDLFIGHIKERQPRMIVLNGDIMDMFRLSRFTNGEGRNPLKEIEACRELLSRIRNACPNSEIFYVIGNHETRLERYVLDKAPELESIIEDIFTILRTEDYKVYGCSSVLLNDKYLFRHGRLLGNKTGLSAIKELEASYMSGATGHSHRLAKYITRKQGRKFVHFETGCLCSMHPVYTVNPDWQQGFISLIFKDGKLRSGRTYEIEDGELLYD